MSDPGQAAVPFHFRVIERPEGAAKTPSWLSAREEEVRTIDFGARRVGASTAWVPRAVGMRATTPQEESVAVSSRDGSDAERDASSSGRAPVAAPSPASKAASQADSAAPMGSRESVGSHPTAEPAHAPGSAPQTAATPQIGTLDAAGSSGPGPVPPRETETTPGVPPALTAAIEALTAARAELFAQAEGELVELAVEIARSVLGTELETRPELHRTLVRAALDVLRGESAPRVRLSPEAFDAILAVTGSRVLETQGHHVQLEPDPQLRGAGAVLDGGSASVDGRLDTRLDRVRDALLVARRATPIGAAA